jgi:Alanine dehydrogenase/PNT, N-terminal domain
LTSGSHFFTASGWPPWRSEQTRTRPGAGAGDSASIPDRVFADAGVEIAPDEAAALADADIVLKVQRPLTCICS